MRGDGAGRGLLAACATAALMPLNSTMVAVAVPDIAADLHERSGVVTQALVATYLVAAIALQSPGGKLGDRFGHARVLLSGQVALAAGAVLGFVSPTLAALVLSRVLMAAGGAVVVPATLALVRLRLPPERRGRAFGAFGAVMSFAAGIGPIVGGELVHAFGWRSVFVANVPVLAASVLLTATTRLPQESRHQAAPRFDRAGSVLLTLALTGVVAGLETSSAAGRLVLGAGVLLFVPFAWWEGRAADPVIAFSLFRSRTFTAGTIVVALLNLVMYALLFEIPLVLRAVARASAAASGRLLVLMMIAMVVASLAAGRLTDRLGPRPLAVLGTATTLGGVLLVRSADLTASTHLRVALALVGAGIGLANPAAQHASLAGAAATTSGMAAGVNSTMRYLGGVAGVALLGRLVDPGATTPVLVADHRAVTSVFAFVLVATLVCAVLTGPAAIRRRPLVLDRA